MAYLNIIFKFLIGGFTVVGATLLAKHINPKWAGLLVAAPIISIVSLFFIYLENSASITQKYLIYSMYFMIPAFLFLLGIYLSMKKLNFADSFVLGAILFVVVTLILQHFV